MKLTITTGTEQDFFQRGKEIARKADAGGIQASENIISFEDPADILEIITAARLALFRAIRESPGSIAEIARRLGRDRSAVKRDVDVLAATGLVSVEAMPFSGHGRMKYVKAMADNFRFVAEV